MLHKEVVKRETLELLKELQNDEFLKSFHLAGGTALALYLGHRKSIDLDLFTPYDFDAEALKNHLEREFNLITSLAVKNTVKGSIRGVKIDCITHPYPYLKSPFSEDGIRLYDISDK